LFLSGKEKQVEEPEEYAVKNWIVRVQGFLIGCATHGFTENYPSIMEGSYGKDLFYGTSAEPLMDLLGNLAFREVFTSDAIYRMEVAEGAVIPRTDLKLKEGLVRLKKRGRMLCASYEALRFQRLDLFTVALRQIGSRIARSQLEDAVEVLLLGDGSAAASASSNSRSRRAGRPRLRAVSSPKSSTSSSPARDSARARAALRPPLMRLKGRKAGSSSSATASRGHPM